MVIDPVVPDFDDVEEMIGAGWLPELPSVGVVSDAVPELGTMLPSGMLPMTMTA